MPHLNHTGPEGKGPKTGRKLGDCKKKPGEESKYELGTGMGKRRKNPSGKGLGKRLRSGNNL